ncbi:MAG: Do family serine endopeptidase, partial [Candidatus Aerophobetes bacterium]|nr:Do family serine endopeptidase [Candidatus Aerophobetes bacterium]
PSFAEIKELRGPLYQESIEPHFIEPNSLQAKVIQVVDIMSPAVVSISTEKTVRTGGEFEFPDWGQPPFDEFFKRFFEEYPQREFKQKGLGSGMIINKDGYVLTNEHVIHKVDKDKIRVTLAEGRTLKAQIVGSDEESDIAILKIKGDNLPIVTLGDSDNLKVGQWAIAIGNPFGYALSQLSKRYEPTVTTGVISATGRAMPARGSEGTVKTYTDLIQTDASINPGNSGGPLVNIWGEVIGINTAIFSPSGGSIGIGFAIPINKAKRIMESLVKYGKVEWAWIGIVMQPELTPELAEKFGVKKGVLVTDVVKGSPAEKAGIRAGDVIQKVNGKEVNSWLALKEEVLKTKIGEKITLNLIRRGKKISVTLTTARKPEKVARLETKEKEEEKLLGIKVSSITSELREKYGIGEDEKGVIITEIEEGSPADKVGLNSGDVIKEVNHQIVTDLDDFKKAVEKVNPGEVVLLRVRRGGWSVYITIKTRK